MATFDDLALVYDNAIDWNARLKREMPFILESFTPENGMLVLDMACGSGRHSVSLAENGFTVDAFDTSKAMLLAAQTLAGERGVTVNFVIGDMLQISQQFNGGYNGILCLGNSLALLPSLKDIQAVVIDVYNLLSDKGTFILQTLNFEEIESTGFRKFPTKSSATSTGEEVEFDRHFEQSSEINSETVKLVFSTRIKNLGEWKHRTTEQNVLRLKWPILNEILSRAGFATIEVFSDYNGSTFSNVSSRSMVVRASKC